MRSERVAAGPTARWLLLVCTIIGLAAMHSLGHRSSHTGAGHGGQSSITGHGEQSSVVPAVSAVMWSGSMTALLAAAPAAVTGSACTGECHGAGGPDRRRDDMLGFSVCLAVLAAFGIAVLLAWLRLGVPAPAWGRAGTRASGAASRAPPRAGTGLRLVTLSVMRR